LPPLVVPLELPVGPDDAPPDDAAPDPDPDDEVGMLVGSGGVSRERPFGGP
jgi:hypothetical protein